MSLPTHGISHRMQEEVHGRLGWVVVEEEGQAGLRWARWRFACVCIFKLLCVWCYCCVFGVIVVFTFCFIV